MLAALILACHIDNRICKTFTGPEMYQTADECIDSIGVGIKLIEDRGWFIKDYTCYDWGTET